MRLPALAFVAGLAACGPVQAQDRAQDRAQDEPRNSGWTLFLDNDALAFADRDGDYTGGFALTLAGTRARDYWFSLDPVLQSVDFGLGLAGPAVEPPRHALQIGVLAFTPENIKAPAAPGDRPYASLVYLANSRLSFPGDRGVAWLNTVVLGALGLDVAESVTRFMHATIDTNQPRGWDDQISDGGEPTFRYSLARLHRLAGGSGFELKDSLGLSVGYITEATASLSLRAGRLSTPWWSFAPERAHYAAEPVPVVAPTSGRELYGWVGLMARTRLYNAFLQGQMRDSALSYHRRETRSLIGEAWLGVTAQVGREVSLSLAVRGQTSELRSALGDRDLIWGSLLISRAF